MPEETFFGFEEEAPQALDLQALANTLSDYGVCAIIRKILLEKNQSKEIDPLLAKIRDDVFSDEPWSEARIKEAMSCFYQYPLIRDSNGNQISSLNPEGVFTKYLCEKFSFFKDNDELKTLLQDIFSLLAQSSVVSQSKRELFFINFPPQEEDLMCLGGSGSRIEELRRALELDEDNPNRYFLDAYTASLSMAVDIAKEFTDAVNEVHIPRYIEYVMSFLTALELKEFDKNSLNTRYEIPTKILAQILEEFPKNFRASLARSFSEGELKRDIQDIISLKITEAVNKANESQDPNYSDEDKITEAYFTETQKVNDLLNKNPRVTLAIFLLLKELDLPEEDSNYQPYFGINPLEEVKTDSWCKLDREKLGDALYKKIIQDLAKKISAPAELQAQELPPQEDKTPLSVRIFSEKIKNEIKEDLLSQDRSRIGRAIDILQILSEKTKGCAIMHFVSVLKDPEIRKAINKHFSANPSTLRTTVVTRQKIQYSDYEGNVVGGIYAVHKASYGDVINYRTQVKENLDTAPRQFFLAQILATSTERALEYIDGLHKAGSLSQVLEKNKDQNYIYSGIGLPLNYREAIRHLILRGDCDIILEKILDILNRDLSSYKEIPKDFLQEARALYLKYNNNPNIIKKLEKLFGDDEKYLWTATGMCQPEIVEKLIAAGANVNQRFDNGSSALQLASSQGHTEIVKKLIAAGANVNHINYQGYNSLQGASNQGHKEIVEELIAAGADVNKQDFSGAAPLQFAIAKGHKEIVEKLIAAGADVNLKNNDKLTPLQHASNNKDIVHKLMMAGAIVKDKLHFTKHQLTLEGKIFDEQPKLEQSLQSKVGSGFIDYLEALDHEIKSPLLLPCLLNFQNSKGKNALYFATKLWDIENIKTLVGLGADFNIKNQANGLNFLECAIKNRKYDVLESLMTEDEDKKITQEIIKSAINSVAKDGKSLFENMLLSKDREAIKIFALADSRYNEGNFLKEIKDKKVEQEMSPKAKNNKKYLSALEAGIKIADELITQLPQRSISSPPSSSPFGAAASKGHGSGFFGRNKSF